MQLSSSVSSSSAIESYGKTSIGQTALVLKSELNKGLREINQHIPEYGRVCVDILISSDHMDSNARISLAASILISKITKEAPDGTIKSGINLKITMGSYRGGQYASPVNRTALTNPEALLCITSEESEEAQSATDQLEVQIQRYPLISEIDLNRLGETQNQPTVKIAQIINRLFPEGFALPKDQAYIQTSLRVMMEAPSLQNSLYISFQSGLRSLVSEPSDQKNKQKKAQNYGIVSGRPDRGEFEKSVEAANGIARPNWSHLIGAEEISKETFNCIVHKSHSLPPSADDKSKIIEID